MDEDKVAGYYRVSLARDNMHASELYEGEITRYCSYKALTLGRIYSDVDYSAFRGARPRPSLEELVKERTRYGAMIVPKLSRFGRSMKELIGLLEIFDSDGIPLVFLDMNLDTSTSQGRLLRHILAAFASGRIREGRAAPWRGGKYIQPFSFEPRSGRDIDVVVAALGGRGSPPHRWFERGRLG